MDLRTLIATMTSDGTVQTLARDPLAQFGPPSRQYLGATLLPEQTVNVNAYRERSIRYRTVIANSGTRYSPVQLKDDNTLGGSMLVELGNQDIGRQFTGEDYDAFVQLLNARPTMDSVTQLLRWTDVTVLRAILDLNEKMRWQALLDGQIVATGDNGFAETIVYPQPSGHRVNAGGTWSDNNYDPYPDILAIVQLLADKGYIVNRLIGTRKVATILQRNAKMAARMPLRLQVSVGTNQMVGRAVPLISLADLNGIFAADGIPPLEINEQQYYDYAGAHRFVRDTSLFFACTTGRDQVVTEIRYYENNEIPILTDTLGYTAIGRAVGQSGPGRVIRLEAYDDKPPRIQAEGWQTAIPVITEPEALAVINAIG